MERGRDPPRSVPPPPGLEGRDPPSLPPGLDLGDSDDVGEKLPPVEPPPSDLLAELGASLAGEVCGPLCDVFPPAAFFDANVSDNLSALLTLSNAAVW